MQVFYPTWGDAVLSTGQSFVDCTETSLLNLLRVILSTPEKKVILPQWDTIHPKVIDFFTNKSWKTNPGESDLEALLSKEAKNAWAEVASNLFTNIQ